MRNPDVDSNKANVPTSAKSQSHWILSALSRVALGAYDGCSIPLTLYVLYGSTTLQKKFRNCFIMNGLVLLGSVLLQRYVIGPLFGWMISAALSFFVIPESQQIRARWMTETLVHALVYSFWIIPMFLLSFYLNGSWYQDIANRSFELFVGKMRSENSNKSKSASSLFRGLVQDLYRYILLSTFLVQSSLSYHIPFIGPYISFSMYSLGTSYYSFECIWIRRGWSLKQRIIYFENHWLYFFGFGLPCSMATFFLSTIISQGLFSLIFPMLIIMASRATPRIPTDEHTNHRLHVFRSSEFVANSMIGWLKNTRNANEAKYFQAKPIPLSEESTESISNSKIE